MNIRYRVELSQEECDQLTAFLSGGKHPARKIKSGLGANVSAAPIRNILGKSKTA